MNTPGSHRPRSPLLGFLGIRSGARGGIRGGYLIINDFGRPLEFHYSSELIVPVGQRALYGTTFEAYAAVEVIARPLTERQDKCPNIVFVDDPLLLGLRQHIPAPVLLLEARDQVVPGSEPFAIRTAPEFPADADSFDRLREVVPATFDFLEPFERITDALAEVRDPIVLVA